MQKNEQSLAPFSVLLAGMLWGLTGIFVRHYNELGLNSLDIVGIRSIVLVIGSIIICNMTVGGALKRSTAEEIFDLFLKLREKDGIIQTKHFYHIFRKDRNYG